MPVTVDFLASLAITVLFLFLTNVYFFENSDEPKFTSTRKNPTPLIKVVKDISG
jgi:hypothetical protein